MDGRRSRWRSLGEWMVAAALMAAVALFGLNLLGEFRGPDPAIPQAEETGAAAPPPPSAVPPRAVSVPFVPLAGNVRIQVGEFAADVLARVRDLVQAGADVVERRADGERTTREFRHAGGRFFLVTESSEDAQPRITAIFIP
ncbi:MAG: hypothetical protein ABL986_00890 [Vicinamibacterales bacterium]